MRKKKYNVLQELEEITCCRADPRDVRQLKGDPVFRGYHRMLLDIHEKQNRLEFFDHASLLHAFRARLPVPVKSTISLYINIFIFSIKNSFNDIKFLHLK